MPFHIHGPLSHAREPPRSGTEGPQGPLMPLQAQGAGFRFFKLLPLHLCYICDAPVGMFCFYILLFLYPILVHNFSHIFFR